jgi:hypothetical protein
VRFVLHLRHFDLAQQVLSDFCRLLGGTEQPLQGRLLSLLSHTYDKANIAQADTAQQELEHDDNFFFRRAQIEEDALARLEEGVAAQKETL